MLDKQNADDKPTGFLRADLIESACIVAGGVVGGGVGMVVGLLGASLIAATIIGAFVGKLVIRFFR